MKCDTLHSSRPPARDEAPVEAWWYAFTMPDNLVFRTAGYETRTSSGTGGEGREAFLHTD
jgi:hypothetical protein